MKSPTTTTPVIEQNLASNLLARIGKGTADADFARRVSEVLRGVEKTGKKGSVTLKVDFELRDDGGIELRAAVAAKIPELRGPATTMHLGSRGELLTQQEFLLGGGADEAEAVRRKPLFANSGLAQPPAPAPIAQGALPAAPIAGQKPDAESPEPQAEADDADSAD
jgi:hypothetical protein